MRGGLRRLSQPEKQTWWLLWEFGQKGVKSDGVAGTPRPELTFPLSSVHIPPQSQSFHTTGVMDLRAWPTCCPTCRPAVRAGTWCMPFHALQVWGGPEGQWRPSRTCPGADLFVPHVHDCTGHWSQAPWDEGSQLGGVHAWPCEWPFYCTCRGRWAGSGDFAKRFTAGLLLLPLAAVWPASRRPARDPEHGVAPSGRSVGPFVGSRLQAHPPQTLCTRARKAVPAKPWWWHPCPGAC